VFLPELAGSNGIADLVAARLRSDWRSQVKFQLVPPQWAYTYYRLPYRRLFTSDTVEQIAGISADHARRLLRLFSENDLVRRTESRTGWVKTFQPRPIASDVVAFEAKLRDWRIALYQASRHASYAHRTWVVLDERRAGSAIRALPLFKSRNVGLATIGRDAEIRKYFQPRAKVPFDPIALWRINNELIRRLSKSRRASQKR
jgi:hypothetical protein